VVQPRLPAHQPPRLTVNGAIMRDGARLPLFRWLPATPPKAAVIAVRGFNDYAGAFADLGPALAREGIAAYAYDQRGLGGAPGRGLWAGQAAMSRDLAEVAGLVQTAHPDIQVRGLGESMGGTVIMAALTAEAHPVIDGAVLSAPAWGPPNHGPGAEGSADPTPATVGAVWGARRDRPPARHLPDALMPAGTRLGSPLADGALPDGYHMLFRNLSGDLATRDIAAWPIDPTAALPSGHERQPDPQTDNPHPGFCPPPAR